MATEGSDNNALLNVVELDYSTGQTHCNNGLFDLDAADVGIEMRFAYLLDSLRGIQKNLIIKSDSKRPFLHPVHIIQVEVISVFGGIKHLDWTMQMRIDFLQLFWRAASDWLVVLRLIVVEDIALVLLTAEQLLFDDLAVAVGWHVLHKFERRAQEGRCLWGYSVGYEPVLIAMGYHQFVRWS